MARSTQDDKFDVLGTNLVVPFLQIVFLAPFVVARQHVLGAMLSAVMGAAMAGMVIWAEVNDIEAMDMTQNMAIAWVTIVSISLVVRLCTSPKGVPVARLRHDGDMRNRHK